MAKIVIDAAKAFNQFCIINSLLDELIIETVKIPIPIEIIVITSAKIIPSNKLIFLVSISALSDSLYCFQVSNENNKIMGAITTFAIPRAKFFVKNIAIPYKTASINSSSQDHFHFLERVKAAIIPIDKSTHNIQSEAAISSNGWLKVKYVANVKAEIKRTNSNKVMPIKSFSFPFKYLIVVSIL